MAEEIASTRPAGVRSRHCVEQRLDLLGRQQVRLREHDQLGQAARPVPVRRELPADGRVGRLGDRCRAPISTQVDEHAAALDVSEELVAEPGAVGGALDQPRDVGEDQLALVVVDRAEDRLERRERVVGDLGRRSGQAREQRGLAGVGQPDEPGVGQQPQLQLDPARRAEQPALGEPRRLAGAAVKRLLP